MSDNDVRLTDDALADLLNVFEHTPLPGDMAIQAAICLRELISKRAELAHLQTAVARLKADVAYLTSDDYPSA